MAQIQEYYNPNELYASLPQPQSRCSYDLSSFTAVCPETSMAHHLLVSDPRQLSPSQALTLEQQSPFGPEHRMLHSQWSMPPTSISSNMVTAPNQVWGQPQTSSDHMAWVELPNEPHVQELMFTSDETLYSHNASQSTGKVIDFGSSSFWSSNGMSNTAPSPSADILLSPVSPFSDAKHTYSPGSDCSPATPNRSTASYSRLNGAMKVSSPGFVPSTTQSVTQQNRGSAAIQHACGVPMTSARPFHVGNTFENTTMYGSEHSYEHSQSISPGMTPWYPPGYTGQEAAVAQDSQHQQQADTPPFDRRPNFFLAPLERNSRQRQGQWSNKSAVPAQSHFQSRFMTPLTDSEKAQRTKDDEILLELKRDGYTYRDIRKRLGRKVAESTLRGRYRSLTKPRSDRVRAPKWTEIDIVLLKRYVQEEFDKLDVTQPSLEAKQKPEKIPWAKIVDTIARTGGTYKFGAATAKKKWREVSHSASARSSRRRSQA